MTTEVYNYRCRAYVPRKASKLDGLSRNIWGYIRVSTDRQVDGTSIDSQNLAIAEEALKWQPFRTFIATVRDVEPGGKTRFDQRPGGKELLERMKPGDVLIISKVDRFSRSVVDGLQELRDLWRRSCCSCSCSARRWRTSDGASGPRKPGSGSRRRVSR
jgi:hypothetical protein